jgi:hypothetical protein
MRISVLVNAVLLTVLLVHPSTAGAQGVTPADAQAFLGTWAIDLDTPGGPITVDLTLTDTAGAVSGEIGGGGSPMATISEIVKTGSSLVMKYELDLQGAVTPITVTVDVDGDTLTASFDAAGTVLPGSGTRK